MKPYKLIDMPNKALPSDSAFREDLIYKRMDNNEKAQVFFVISQPINTLIDL